MIETTSPSFLALHRNLCFKKNPKPSLHASGPNCFFLCFSEVRTQGFRPTIPTPALCLTPVPVTVCSQLSCAPLTACQAAAQLPILWDMGEDGQPCGKTEWELGVGEWGEEAGSKGGRGRAWSAEVKRGYLFVTCSGWGMLNSVCGVSAVVCYSHCYAHAPACTHSDKTFLYVFQSSFTPPWLIFHQTKGKNSET